MTTKIRIGQRGYGKTHELIQWMKDKASPGVVRVMICFSEWEVDRLQQENKDIEGWRFVNCRNLESLRGRHDIVLCIDNMDLVLNRLFPGLIDRITATDWMIL